MKMSMKILLVLASAALVSGQRPFFAGSKPIGYPEIITTTAASSGLDNKFGESDSAVSTTTQRLPIEALGDKDLVDRLSKLPIDKQPFWLLNWQALEAHRQNPMSYPQRPSQFFGTQAGNVPNSGIGNVNPGVGNNVNPGNGNVNSGFGNTNNGVGNANSRFGNTNSGNVNSGFGNTNPGNQNSGLGNSNSGFGNVNPASGNENVGFANNVPMPTNGNENSGFGNTNPGLGNSNSGFGNVNPASGNVNVGFANNVPMPTNGNINSGNGETGTLSNRNGRNENSDVAASAGSVNNIKKLNNSVASDSTLGNRNGVPQGVDLAPLNPKPTSKQPIHYQPQHQPNKYYQQQFSAGYGFF